MKARIPDTIPRVAACIWAVAAAISAVGLALSFGFREPLIAPGALRLILAAGLAIFAASRLYLLFPAELLWGRLRRWWVDYVLVVAAIVWRVAQPGSEAIILPLGAIYILIVTGVTLARSGIDALVRALTGRRRVRPVLCLLIGGMALAIVGGAVLTLPACWGKPYTGEKASQYANHALNCFFTSTAALTGTGLTPLEVGQDFSRAGLAVILVLMQVGGLLTLVIGSAVAWRFRQLLGWGGEDDDANSAGLRRLISFVIAFTLIVETLGAIPLYRMWDAAADPNFARLVVADSGAVQPARVLASAFHAVSAFCNVGLSLPREGMLTYASRVPTYLVLLPLIVLGGLGGTVLFDLWRRIRPAQSVVAERHSNGGTGGNGSPGLDTNGGGAARLQVPAEPPALRDEPALRRRLPLDSRVTLIATGLLIVLGAGLLFAIESTAQYQPRYPKDTNTGRIKVWQRAPQDLMVFSAEQGERIQAQRLRTMSTPARAWGCLFQGVAARSGGMQTVRLDEPSLSPASRWLLMGLMLVGGGLGGAAGGVRIVLVVLLLICLIKPGKVKPVAVSAAVAVSCAVLLLFAGTTLVLLYAETGSLEACSFESLSACCNVGLSSGLTAQLSPVGRSLLIVTMLLGRILPLALLFRAAISSQGAPEIRVRQLELEFQSR